MSHAVPHLPLVCPRCRHLDANGELHVHPLVLPQSDGVAVVGALPGRTEWLECSLASCGAEYPVIDGIPVVFADLDAVARAGAPLTDATALPARTVAALLTGTDPERPLAQAYARLARYAWAGFHDWMSGVAAPLEVEVHAVAFMAWLSELGEADVLDDTSLPGLRGVLGSALGREAWCTPRRPTILMDAHLPSLRAARALSRERRLSLAAPIEPGLWSPVEIEVPHDQPEPSVAFLCCDVCDPPVHGHCLASVLAPNLIDSVADPYLALGQANAMRAPDGGVLAVSTPFAWRPEVTDRASWLTRGSGPRGDGEAGLFDVVSQVGPELSCSDRAAITWGIRNGDREMVVYRNLALCFR